LSIKIIEDKDFISDEQKKTITRMIGVNEGDVPELPFYVSDSCVEGDGIPFMYHTIVGRAEHGWKDIGTIMSPHYEFFFDLLRDFALNNDIQVNGVLRCCVNLTMPTGSDSKGSWHYDHDFDYKHLIIYLNDGFTGNASTLVEIDGEVIEIDPEIYKGVYFSKRCNHAMTYPDTGCRIVVVYTFV